MNKFYKRCAAALAACTVLAAALPVTFPTAAADNIISNSTFESGTTGWGTYQESGGKCSLSTEDGKLALTVSSVGKLNYSVQATYDIIPLYKNGVYRLSYDISSSIDREVEGMIQLNGGDYHSYTWKGIKATSTPQTISYEFTMEDETDIMAKMVFNCGIHEGEDADMPEHKIYLDNVSLELIDDSNVDYSANKPYQAPIIVDQVGYKTDSKKTAVIRQTPDIDGTVNAHVVNADTNEVVYSAPIGDAVENTSANEKDHIFDFSEVKTAGKYYIQCDGIDDNSYTFEIGDDVYGDLLNDSVKMLYLQRCGTEVKDDVFGHAACHNSMATIYGTNQQIDVSGGWHDAGDFGRYVVPAAKAVADLMYAYSETPELYGDNIGIPESGNGVPDILDEARFELEWMKKMQSESGGVYHKVSCESFPGYVMPDEEREPLIVTPVSTTATADFCASMAMAYEFYTEYDKDFAESCLAAAEKAWAFLESNPDFIFKNPEDIVTGDYGDKTDRDERYWAAAQMYRTTKDEKYLSAASQYSNTKGLDWSTVGDYGNIAILTMDGIDKESSAYQNAKNTIITQADTFAANSENSPYGVALVKFEWGSNMTVANAGIVLSLAGKLTGEEKYALAAKAQIDYLLGENPLGTCFVTGYGTVSPEHPHHRPSIAKDTAMKGMLVGGVNSALEDSAAKAYCQGEPPAKCYIDNSESYSTNEITIYWNSPLTYLLSLTSSDTEPPVTDITWGDTNCDDTVDLADAVLIMQFSANPDEYGLNAPAGVTEQGILNGDVYETGSGLTNSDALSIQKYKLGLIDKLPES